MKHKYFIIFSLFFIACTGKSVQGKYTAKESRVYSEDPKAEARITILFKNQNGEVRALIDPNYQDYHLDFRGNPSNESKIIQPQFQEIPNTNTENQTNQTVPINNIPTETPVTNDSIQKKTSLDPELQKNLVELNQLAQEAFYKKNYQEAEKIMQKSIDLHPTAQAYALLGSIAFMQEHSERAKMYWMRSLELNPSQPIINESLLKLNGEL
jgi:tetratricopeptide (TPR) repeat protein